MEEYIRRDLLISRIKEEPTDGMFTHEILDAINGIPAADVAPVTHARWKDYSVIWNGYRCSHCDLPHRDCTIYCPNCGSKMDLEVGSNG